MDEQPWHTGKAKFAINMNGSPVIAQIKEIAGPEKWELRWDDGMNREAETYDRLGDALSRLALLVECGEAHWDKAFNCGEVEHGDRWNEFTNNNINWGWEAK